MMTAEQLKNSILQRALQGRLVEQNPADESAQKLLERIRAEKKSMIKAGTIPKDKKMEDVSEDEQLFDLPKSWIWTRMGELFQHNTGKALNGTNKDGEELTYITTSNLYWNRFKLENLKSMPFTESEIEKCTVTKGDLLVCEGGDYGRAAIWNYDFDMRIQNHVHRLRAYLPLCTEYFYYVINFLKGTGLIKGKGIAIQGLSSGALHNLAVPLPPLEEQKRIVAKIEELMLFVEQYAEASTRLNTLNASFPEQMKKSILQQAVMGKLVQQDPNDEPASGLLKKIAEEKQKLLKEGKIKRQKALPAITEDEIPFEIPESWEWVRLNEIIENVPANGFSPKGVDYPTDYKNLTLTATTSGTFKANAFKYVDITKEQAEKYFLKEDDILIQRSNSRELVGTACLYTEESNKYIYPDLMMRIHALDGIWSQYLVMTLQSPYVREYYQQNASGSSQSMPKINQSIVGNTLIPIPPLHEQKKIVQTVNRLIPTLSSLCQ